MYDRKYSAINLADHAAFDWNSILEGVGIFYFSGVTPAISDEIATACKEALSVCRERGIVTACDVNYRGKMWSPEKSQQVMRELLPLVDIVIANDEDAPAGLGMTCVSGSLKNGIAEREDYVEMARQICAEYGCKQLLSVIRDIDSVEDSRWMGMLYSASNDNLLAGSQPSDEHWFSPIYDMHVFEGVAAGDAFSGAYLHVRPGRHRLRHSRIRPQAHHPRRFQPGYRRRDRSRCRLRRRRHPRGPLIPRPSRPPLPPDGSAPLFPRLQSERTRYVRAVLHQA